MLHRLVICCVLPAFLMLGACEGYDVRVNDKIVYTPIPLFSDFTTPDPGLNSCLEQAINDGAITSAQQLTALDCSFAGIETLDGLSTFSALRALRLSGNKVRNLVDIKSLVELQELYLDDNQVIDPVPLYQLPALTYVDLTGNTALQCPQPGSFREAIKLLLPKHCL